MPLTPLEQSSAIDDNKHTKKPDINIAEVATENTDEEIKQSMTAPTYLMWEMATPSFRHQISVQNI